MAHLQINVNIGCGDIFVLGQLFAFGSIVLHTNATGRLDRVESFAPNQVVMFWNLEYTADSRGDLALSDWGPDRLGNSSGTTASTPESASDPDLVLDLTSDPTLSADPTTIPSELDLESNPTSEPALSSDPITTTVDQELTLADQSFEVASSNPPNVLQVSPTYCQKMGPMDLSLLNEVLDRIQGLGISDGQSSVYDQIGLKADDREIYVTPTTHLVAMVEDLTDVLDYASDEANDIDEYVDDASGVASPMAIPHTGNWAATSTYDVYMVDTPKEDGEENNDPPSVAELESDPGVLVKARGAKIIIQMLLTTTPPRTTLNTRAMATTPRPTSSVALQACPTMKTPYILRIQRIVTISLNPRRRLVSDPRSSSYPRTHMSRRNFGGGSSQPPEV